MRSQGIRGWSTASQLMMKKRCQDLPTAPWFLLHETHRGKKADGHSSDASWMWSKFCELKARYFLLMSTAYRQKARKKSKMKTQFFYLTMSWMRRRPSRGSSISSFRSSSRRTSKCQVMFLSGSPRTASSFDLSDRQSARFPRPQHPHIRHPWLRLGSHLVTPSAARPSPWDSFRMFNRLIARCSPFIAFTG